MARSLPERTIDAWVSGVVCSRFANARIWAPTQLATNANWDYGMDLGNGKLFILEDKATQHVSRTTLPDTHRINIDPAQLDWYCDVVEPHEGIPVYYVLPKPPWSSPPTGGVVPSQAVTRYASPAGPFEKWAFVIRCTDLRKELGGRKSFQVGELPFPSADSLLGFFKALEECEVGARISGPGKGAGLAESGEYVAPTEAVAEPSRLDSPEQLAGSALAVFIPESNLPNFQ